MLTVVDTTSGAVVERVELPFRVDKVGGSPKSEGRGARGMDKTTRVTSTVANGCCRRARVPGDSWC